MKEIVTIKGLPIIEVYESYDGSYWFVTEKAYKQDSVIDGEVYKDDQVFFGYVRLSSCPEFAEFGYFSEAQLKSLGWRVWKVPKENWAFCPEVEVQDVADDAADTGDTGRPAAGRSLSRPYAGSARGGSGR